MENRGRRINGTAIGAELGYGFDNGGRSCHFDAFNEDTQILVGFW